MFEVLNQDFRIPKKKNVDYVWNEYTVMFDKQYKVSVTFFSAKFFPKCVDAAMPNNI